MTGADGDRWLVGGIAAAAVVTVAIVLWVTPPGTSPLNPGACPQTNLCYGPIAVGYASGPTSCGDLPAPNFGCWAPWDYSYRAIVEESEPAWTFARFYAEVDGPGDSPYPVPHVGLHPSTGEITVLGPTGAIIATFQTWVGGPLAMQSPGDWTYDDGAGPATTITVQCAFVIDVGSNDTAGIGLWLTIHGVSGLDETATTYLP